MEHARTWCLAMAMLAAGCEEEVETATVRVGTQPVAETVDDVDAGTPESPEELARRVAALEAQMANRLEYRIAPVEAGRSGHEECAERFDMQCVDGLSSSFHPLDRTGYSGIAAIPCHARVRALRPDDDCRLESGRRPDDLEAIVDGAFFRSADATVRADYGTGPFCLHEPRWYALCVRTRPLGAPIRPALFRFE